MSANVSVWGYVTVLEWGDRRTAYSAKKTVTDTLKLVENSDRYISS